MLLGEKGDSVGQAKRQSEDRKTEAQTEQVISQVGQSNEQSISKLQQSERIRANLKLTSKISATLWCPKL